MVMELHDRRDVLDVKNAAMANSRFDDVNLSNTHFHNTNLSAAAFEKVLLSNARVVDANVSGTLFSNVNMSNVKIETRSGPEWMIDGVKVADLFIVTKRPRPPGTSKMATLKVDGQDHCTRPLHAAAGGGGGGRKCRASVSTSGCRSPAIAACA
jgi:hypothetical protein